MTKVPAVSGAIAPETQGKFVDRVVAGLAASQHGVVARRQLADRGVTRDAIRHRLDRKRLHVVHPGVYAFGRDALTLDGMRTAAVLAIGAGSVLSHRAAAALLDIRPYELMEVTTARQCRGRPGIVVHHLPLSQDEVTIVRAIPVTSISRTLFDLAAVLPRAKVERAINEAEFRRLASPLSRADLVDRYPGRKGIGTIKAILEDLRLGGRVIRSELEDRFLAFVQSSGMPKPEVNVPLQIAGRWIECDCVWRDARVIVELDGRAAHDTAAAFERDRARDRTLHARGWRVVRVTWRHLHSEAKDLAYDLRTLLSSDTETAPSRSTSQLPASS